MAEEYTSILSAWVICLPPKTGFQEVDKTLNAQKDILVQRKKAKTWGRGVEESSKENKIHR